MLTYAAVCCRMLTYADVILQVRHMFREMAVRSGSGGGSGGSDGIDSDCFCSVLQEHELDRPAGTYSVLSLYCICCAACCKRTNSTDQQAHVFKCHLSSSVLVLLYMCSRTTIYVSSYYYICVLILLYMCSRTTIYVFWYTISMRSLTCPRQFRKATREFSRHKP